MNKEKSHLQTYLRLIGYLRYFKWTFALAIGFNIMFAGLDASLAYLLKPLLEKGFIDRDEVFIKYLPLAIIVLFTLRGSASFFAKYLMSRVGQNIIRILRQAIFERVLYLTATYYDNHSSGQMLAKIIYNVEQVSSACAESLTSFARSVFLIIGLLVVMLVISWQFTLIFVVVLPLMAIIVKIASRKLRRAHQNVQGTVASVTHIAEETLEGYKVVRAFGAQEYERKRFVQATNEYFKQQMKAVKTAGWSVPVIQIAASFAISAIIFLAASPDSVFSLEAGSFVAFITAVMMLLKPIRDLAELNNTIQRAIAASEGIFEALDAPIEDNSGLATFTDIAGRIEFKNVEFTYHAGVNRVLKGINFSIEAGKTVAIVGKSGSGKSTLMKLLLRLYDIDGGQILIDGQEIRKIQLDNLREQFALVSQDVILFQDTVANNICYGRENVSANEIVAAAKAAHADEFIDYLANGYDTLIGENGVLLSGGQRQRLAIARAILKNAPILILDEATSSLDTNSERHIQAALDELMKNRTSFVIAHRLSTIENADLIIVLDQGTIVESGTHEQLLKLNGAYARLHAMQFKDE